MITICNDCVTAELGNGDICIGCGTVGATSSLILSNIEKVPIGTDLGSQSGVIGDLDSPIVITFTDERCIDGMIRLLKELKNNFNNKKL